MDMYYQFCMKIFEQQLDFCQAYLMLVKIVISTNFDMNNENFVSFLFFFPSFIFQKSSIL